MKKQFLPQQSYLIEVAIKGKYINNSYIKSVKITSTLSSYCPSIEIELSLSAKFIQENKLYGQDPVTLTISLLGQGGVPLDNNKFELICTMVSFGSPALISMSDGKQEEKATVYISGVIKEPFISMTTLSNAIFGGTGDPKTAKEVIEDLVSKTSATLKYDTEGENLEKIDQLCITPKTLYDTILYIDEAFGTHDGVPAVFCRHDNCIHIINLSKRINKNFVAKISQIALDKKGNQLEKKSLDGKNFYTDSFKHEFVGNAKFAAIGTKLSFVTKPSDGLSGMIELDVKDTIKKYGLIYKNPEFYVDPAINRERIIEVSGGFEKSETWARTYIAKKFFNMSTVSCSFGGMILIENLLKVGEPIYIDPLTIEYLDFSGNYILYKSVISYKRIQEADWIASATIDVVRTNKTI